MFISSICTCFVSVVEEASVKYRDLYSRVSQTTAIKSLAGHSQINHLQDPQINSCNFVEVDACTSNCFPLTRWFARGWSRNYVQETF